MPIFEYRCKKCGSKFEKIVLGSSEREIECPRCHSKDLTKLISAFSSAGTSRSSGAASCGTTGSGFS